MTRRGFGIFTFLLVSVIIFCVKGTVRSKEDIERTRQNQYYAALEQEYVKRVKNMLEEEGYDNCGINLTRVTSEDGSRRYKMVIHHRKLEYLSQERREALVDRLGKMEFRDEICSFQYVL